MLLVMVGMAVNLSSCSNNDEYNIVGTWKATDNSLRMEKERRPYTVRVKPRRRRNHSNILSQRLPWH